MRGTGTGGRKWPEGPSDPVQASEAGLGGKHDRDAVGAKSLSLSWPCMMESSSHVQVRGPGMTQPEARLWYQYCYCYFDLPEIVWERVEWFFPSGEVV